MIQPTKHSYCIQVFLFKIHLKYGLMPAFFFFFYLCSIFLPNISTKSDPIKAKRYLLKEKHAYTLSMCLCRDLLWFSKRFSYQRFKYHQRKSVKKCFNCTLKTHKTINKCITSQLNYKTFTNTFNRKSFSP